MMSGSTKGYFSSECGGIKIQDNCGPQIQNTRYGKSQEKNLRRENVKNT